MMLPIKTNHSTQYQHIYNNHYLYQDFWIQLHHSLYYIYIYIYIYILFLNVRYLSLCVVGYFYSITILLLGDLITVWVIDRYFSVNILSCIDYVYCLNWIAFDGEIISFVLYAIIEFLVMGDELAHDCF